LVLALAASRPPSEPTYGGKSLHAWLEGIDAIVLRAAESKGIELEATNAAAYAILATRHQALPWLRHELAAVEPPYRIKLRNVAFRLPTALRCAWLTELLMPPTNPTLGERHRRAAMGALVLGGKAEPLVPELANLLNSGDNCSLYTFALARIGTKGVPALARALTNEATQFNALQALELTAANTEPAVPALLNVLINGSGFPSIQNAFLNARGASNAIIPVIRAYVVHTNSAVSGSAIATLQILETGHARGGWRNLEIDKYGNWGM
jgi:hypothetical protein